MNRPPDHEHLDEQMVKMEVNLDDISGEWLGHVMDLLFESGANDVFYTPIFMKKNRPGVILQLLCSQQEISKMKKILFAETTTLGIRYYPLTVHRLGRTFFIVNTQWGEVTIKRGIHEGLTLQQAPEYEDCRKIAVQNNIPLKWVYEEVWKCLGEVVEK